MRENIAAVMAGFFNCGFARVAARNSVYDENGKVIYDKGTRLQRFLSTFSENKEAFAVSQNTFDKRLPVLLKILKSGAVKASQSTWITSVHLHGNRYQLLREGYIPSRTAGNAT